MPADASARVERERANAAVSKSAVELDAVPRDETAPRSISAADRALFVDGAARASSSARAARRTTTITSTRAAISASRGGNLSTTFTYGHPFLTQESQLPGQPRVWVSTTRRASASYAIARGNWSSETRFGYNYNWLSRTDPFYNVLDPVNPGPSDINAKDRRQLPSIAYPGLLTLGSETAHARAAAELFLRAAGHAHRRPAFGEVRRDFRDAERRPVQRHRSGVHATRRKPTSPPIVQARRRSGSDRCRVCGRTTNWGAFIQDDWRVNGQLVINAGIRYDFFGRYRFEATDAENPAGIINLDGQPDPTFAFGPPRDAGPHLRRRSRHQPGAAGRRELQPGRPRQDGHQRRVGHDVPAARRAELRDLDRDDLGRAGVADFQRRRIDRARPALSDLQRGHADALRSDLHAEPAIAGRTADRSADPGAVRRCSPPASSAR